MRIPKRYGQSQISSCPWCDKQATAKNKQDVPVCDKHKDEYLPDIKCICGEYLELRSGKWGPYFSCMKCGNVNFKRGMENCPPLNQESKPEPKTDPKNYRPKSTPGEITVTSDELDFL